MCSDRVGICVISVLFVVLLSHGCSTGTSDVGNENVVTKTAPVEEHTVSGQEKNVPEPNTMSYWWYLKENGRHAELIEGVQRFIEVELTDFDVDYKGTCRFLEADAFRQLGKFDKAQQGYAEVIQKYPTAVFTTDKEIEIRIRPLCEIGLKLISIRDKSDFSGTSADYTTLAWKFLKKKMYDDADFLADTCINTFHEMAREQQAEHIREYGKKLPRLSPDPAKCEAILAKYWALYDVGTCYYIRVQLREWKATHPLNRTNNLVVICKLYREAIAHYCTVITEYPCAQSFDPKGPWWWSVWKGARKQILSIKEKKSAECELDIPCRNVLSRLEDSPAFQ